MKDRLRLKEERAFLVGLMAPYKLSGFLFLAGSFLASILDGISIGLMVPLLSRLQGGGSTEGLPAILRWFSERLSSESLEKQFLISLSFVVFAVLLKNVFVGFAFKQGVWLSNRVSADLKSSTLQLLLNVGQGFHRQAKLGELIEKVVNNTQKLRELIIYSMQFVVFFMTLLVLLFLMLIFSWQLTLVALVLGGLCALLMSRYLQKLSQLGEVLTRNSRRMLHAVQENLSAISVIQAFGKEASQLSKLKAGIEDNFHSENQLAFRSLWVQPLTEGLGIIAIGILLLASFVILPSDHKIVLAQVLPFLYILVRIVPTLKILNDARAVVLGHWPYLKVVQELLRRDNKPFLPEGKAVLGDFEEEIRFESVSFSYQGSARLALKNISFSIPKGKTTAIMGRSGSGKSTLVNLLLRFYDPQQGAILMDGQPLMAFKLKSYRRKISLVSQDTFLFNESVRYNIAFGAESDVTEKRMIEVATMAGAHDFILALPEQYSTVLGDRGMTLSGGQRQRIAIARAILKDPDILILDEATSALDPVTEQSVHQAIVALSTDRTVVIIAHRFSTLQNADQVVVLENGEIQEIGDIARIRTLYKEQGYLDVS